MTHHLPLASRATAHGVGSGWNDNNNINEGGTITMKEQHTTRPKPHEQLLMGWIMGGMMMMMTQDDGDMGRTVMTTMRAGWQW